MKPRKVLSMTKWFCAEAGLCPVPMLRLRVRRSREGQRFGCASLWGPAGQIRNARPAIRQGHKQQPGPLRLVRLGPGNIPEPAKIFHGRREPRIRDIRRRSTR
ncbi:hypothetical protein VTI74DRAFT_9703 [Chaetomium olivicolor]